MIIELLNKKPERFPGLWLSFSKIETFNQCPAKYRYVYIERLPTKAAEHIIFGNFLHSVLEIFYRDIIINNKQSVKKLMTNVFSKTLEMPDYKGKVSKSQIDEAFSIIKSYLSIIENDIPNVLSVEKQFYLNIDNKILLNGLIDRVQDDGDIIHIIDYKTAKKKKFLLSKTLQLLIYAYIMCLENPNIEKIKTSYMLLRLNFELITKIYSREEVGDIVNNVIAIADRINGEKLWRPKESPLCNWCDFENICEAKIRKKPKKKLVPDNTKSGFIDW